MKVQYDLEGGVLKQNRCSKWLPKIALYGVLLAVVVIGWVVYQQRELLLQQGSEIQIVLSESAELATTEEPDQSESSSTAPSTSESNEKVGIIDALWNPFIESDTAILEVKVDTDGLTIKVGENENSLKKLVTDSEITALLKMGLREMIDGQREGESHGWIHLESDSAADDPSAAEATQVEAESELHSAKQKMWVGDSDEALWDEVFGSGSGSGSK